MQALAESGTACLNGDDPRVDAMARLCRGRTVRYGTGASCDITPSAIQRPIPLLGDHVTYLALAAFAVGREVGMSDEEINDRLAALRPEKGRLSRLPGVSGCTLIDDSYNASPASTRVALGVLEQQPGARRFAFLGDMLELGSESDAAHVGIIHSAARVADRLVLVGRLMAEAHASLPPAVRRDIRVFETALEVVAGLGRADITRPGPDDVVLIKGSQGTRMEHISRALLHESVVPATVLCRQSKSWRQI